MGVGGPVSLGAWSWPSRDSSVCTASKFRLWHHNQPKTGASRPPRFATGTRASPRHQIGEVLPGREQPNLHHHGKNHWENQPASTSAVWSSHTSKAGSQGRRLFNCVRFARQRKFKHSPQAFVRVKYRMCWNIQISSWP